MLTIYLNQSVKAGGFALCAHTIAAGTSGAFTAKNLFKKGGEKMKKIKKIASILLAAIMVIAMAVPTMAADEGSSKTYSITIKSEESGHKFTAYKIFTGTVTDADKEDIKPGYSDLVLGDIEWADAVLGAKIISKLTGEYTTAKDVADALGDGTIKAEEFAAIVGEVLGELEAAGESNSINEEAGGYVISGLEPGYYFIKDELASGTTNASNFMLEVIGNTEATPKAEVPTSEKKVKDINDTTETEAGTWQDSADWDIGDSVPFQLKGTLPTNFDMYKTYKLVFHDEESDGLVFEPESLKVYVDESLITTGYTLNETPGDGCTFEVVFEDVKLVRGAKAGSVITVEYTSELAEGAVIGNSGNPNKMKMEFSNNPYSETETSKTPEDTVVVFTFKFDVNKVNSKEEPLAGAQFSLEKKMKDGTWKLIKEFNTDVTTTEFEFKGIDDGTYRLKETKTPDGYNTMDPNPVEFTVVAEHSEGDAPKLTSLSGNPVDGSTITINASADKGELSTNIVNNKGTELPETGGIGTTIFYVIGAILVIGAGVLLVTKKRTSAK